MKNTLLCLLLYFAVTGMAEAQEERMSNKAGAGFHLNQYQNDFGLGLNLTSPYFASNRIALRLRGNVMFHQHPKDNETTWSPYSNVSLGLIGVGGIGGEFVRLYGEGGIIGLFPSSEFSAETFVFGGYGLFGFEFYMDYGINYYIEIGGIGTGANADKILTSPIYSNGLLISVGFRFHFK